MFGFSLGTAAAVDEEEGVSKMIMVAVLVVARVSELGMGNSA